MKDYKLLRVQFVEFYKMISDILSQIIDIDVEYLDQWEKDVYVTPCELEMHFPPSFVDIMVHLISHIMQEIKLFKRYMGILKGYVRNHNGSEGSIVEGYTSKKVIEFCQDFKSVGVPITHHSGRLEGKGGVDLKITIPTHEELQVANLVVLKHLKCLTQYVDEYIDMLKSKYPGKEHMWCINNHNEEFSRWLNKKVAENDVDENVKMLGHGLDCRVKSYQGYNINDYTFYTKDQD
uniref:DUF4218 domain-containing protein n=1 Tax=Lactuca sativa TaxID=4236 RepID=A0A9R1X7S6_LACSA|nr:hypothetical protein LSAT_V11C600308520 [Lactuca sativa]